MRINANIAALNASRNLMGSNGNLGKSLEKLSSDHRVNRAGDDAAGLSLSEGLRAEIRGNTQAQRNAQDGISYIQTTEGALTEVHAMLQRMRLLAVQAANAGTGDNGVIEQDEVAALIDEIKGIGERTTFSGNQVFTDYGTSSLTFQVGAGTGDTLTAIDQDLTLDPGVGGIFSTVLSVDLTSVSGAHTALDAIDAAITDVSEVRGSLGAAQNRLEHTVANLGIAVENLMASESRIRDADMAVEMVNSTRSQILTQAGTAMLAQANTAPQSILLLLQG
jgi:flagellin